MAVSEEQGRCGTKLLFATVNLRVTINKQALVSLGSRYLAVDHYPVKGQDIDTRLCFGGALFSNWSTVSKTI